MQILIMGAGALGCVVGGFMKKAGHEVYLIGRDDIIKAIEENGLYISGIWGNHHVLGFHTVHHIESIVGIHFDLIIISVKSYDTEVAVKTIQPVVSESTYVCSYQNGLGNVEKIAEYVGMERTIPVRVIFGSKILRPGFVQVTVIAEPTALGRYEQGPPKEVVKEIAEIMNRAGIPTIYADNIEGLIWGKVAYNSALNPLSALLDVPYGRLMETEETRALMRSIIYELYSVAERKHIPMIIPTADAYIDHLFYTLIPPTAQHYASMREDLKLGRRTEIDALNGAIYRLGREMGISCPVNLFLTQIIKAKEQILCSNINA